jgi:hypothetical protein
VQIVAIFHLGVGCTTTNVAKDDTMRDGCAAGDPEEQRRGTDCQCCHLDQFSMAGSVSPDAEVAEIRVSDGVNHAIAQPNHLGNFFRHNQLNPPLTASLVFADGRETFMETPAPHGSCNRCHDGVDEPILGDVP